MMLRSAKQTLVLSLGFGVAKRLTILGPYKSDTCTVSSDDIRTGVSEIINPIYHQMYSTTTIIITIIKTMSMKSTLRYLI